MLAVICVPAFGRSFEYRFKNKPLPQAVLELAADHPDLQINFIYNELENYLAADSVSADIAAEALWQLVGLNPVTVAESRGAFYLEGRQRGRYVYRGRTVDADGEPVPGAAVMFLAPRDSSVITYAVSNPDGRFTVPCDTRSFIVKATAAGYRPLVFRPSGNDLGDIVMRTRAIALRNLTVEADYETIAPDRTVYRPTARQKQFSQTGFDLLRLMAIPTLVVAPGSESVSDVFGNAYSLFINYVPASEADLRGMKITDVKRVEILDSPSDLRFKGARKAVNFIVQEYVYGGYTKLLARERTLNGFENNAELFSRFTFRRLTFDFFGGAQNSLSRHSGSDTRTRYGLADAAITRTETSVGSKKRTDKYPLTLRANYRTERIQLTNQLAFSHGAVPEERQNGDVAYSSRPGHSYSSQSANQSRDNTVVYSGSLYWTFPAHCALDYSQRISHTRRHYSSQYLNKAVAEPITNTARENATDLKLSLYGLKVWSDRHRLRIGGIFYWQDDNVDYFNYPSFTDRMTTTGGAANAEYSFADGPTRLNLSLGAGIERISTNGKPYTTASPYGSVNFNRQLNDRSRISAFAYVALLTPDLTLRQDGIVQSDEFLYLTGNSALRNYKQLVANLAYNISSRRNLALAFFTGTTCDFNRVTTVYNPYNDGRALLRSFVNNGSWTNFYLGTNATLRLFDNNLELYANVSQNFYKTTDRYNESYFPLRVNLQASYFWKHFYVMASWANGNRKLTENSNVVIRNMANYLVEAGWGNNAFSINLRASNFFRTGWKSGYWMQNTDPYTMERTFYNPSAHANIRLSIAYTVGYGRKVNRNNEAGAQSSSSSAILK